MLTKKNIIIVAGIGIVAYLFYKRRSKTEVVSPSSENGEIKPPVTPIENEQKKYVGKGAFAKSDATYVRNAALVNNAKGLFDPINNIVGVLKKDEFAGMIENIAIGKNDGKYWFYVNKGQNYDCPLNACGITFPTKKGWVRSDVVNVK